MASGGSVVAHGVCCFCYVNDGVISVRVIGVGSVRLIDGGNAGWGLEE